MKTRGRYGEGIIGDFHRRQEESVPSVELIILKNHVYLFNRQYNSRVTLVGRVRLVVVCYNADMMKKILLATAAAFSCTFSLLADLYLAGDSTVTDQNREPWGSWGQILPAFVKPGWACVNFARSGLAMVTFEGR